MRSQTVSGCSGVDGPARMDPMQIYGQARRRRGPLLGPMIAVCACLSSGCQGTFNGFLEPVGPSYTPPAAPVADEWSNARTPEITADPVVEDGWWTVFEDAALNQLIQTATEQNLDLKAAACRIAEARALLNVTRGNLFPQTQEAFGQYSRDALSINRVTRNNNVRFFDTWETGVRASWELDFWGQYRRAIRASEAELAAAIYNRHDVLVLLLGDVAIQYIQLREAEKRLLFASRNVEAQAQALEVAESRFEAGLVSELDATQARANLARTRSLIPTLLIQRQQALNTLCILLGVPPQPIEAMLQPDTGIPQPPRNIAVGIPAELLARRPDVRRAERLLAAQSERIGIAAAELYPHLSITGSIGYSANSLHNLFDSDSLTASAGPSFRWNILNYGRIVAAMAVEDARFRQLLYAYQQAVLDAAAEVENGLVGFVQSQDRTESLRASVAAAEQSVELAVEQYRSGTTDFDRIFNLQNFLAQLQDDLAESEGAIAENLVNTYTALGGGWRNCVPPVQLGLIHSDAPALLVDSEASGGLVDSDAGQLLVGSDAAGGSAGPQAADPLIGTDVPPLFIGSGDPLLFGDAGASALYVESDALGLFVESNPVIELVAPSPLIEASSPLMGPAAP